MQKIRNMWNKADTFCRAAAIVGGASALLMLIALCAGKVIGLAVSVIQLVCAVCAMLSHTGRLQLKKKLYEYVLLALAVILVIPNLSAYGSRRAEQMPEETAEPEQLTRYSTSVHIDFEPNIFFNTYDVDLKVDGMTELKLEHGEDADLTLTLEEGIHSFEFVSSENMNVTGSTSINVGSVTFIALRISCSRDSIEVITEKIIDSSSLGEGKTVITFSADSVLNRAAEAVTEELKAMGFTDISVSPLYDLDEGSEGIGTVSELLIDGKSGYCFGDIAAKSAKISILYHEVQSADPMKIKEAEMLNALETAIPLESAKRAVVVAMTNCQDPDVFAEDGNTYDPSKFHSYSDLDSFFCTVSEDGEWSASGEAWQVSGMILKIFGYDTYMRIDARVSKSGDRYTVSDVSQLIGSKDAAFNNDTSIYGINRMEPSDYHTYLTVPEELIAEDRDSAVLEARLAEEVAKKAAEKKEKQAAQSRQEWIASQFSAWNGRHIELTRLIKESMNDKKSFEFVDATYVDISNSDVAAEVNATLSTYGFSDRVEVGDLLVFETFTGKNAFNATVKNTAYGIVSSSGTVRLIGID